MSLSALILAALAAGDVKVDWRAPSALITGLPYEVQVSITAPEGGAKVDSWMLTEAAFEVDGNPLGERKGAKIDLPAGFTLSGPIDLAPALGVRKDFKLTHASGQGEAVNVRAYETAPKDLDFMDAKAMSAADLSRYRVLLRTNRGDILLKMWPETAPNHVRNFLDLSAEGFYDGLTFHRVAPGFMIQGGDPTGSGMGSGPRTVKAEFQRERKHVPGVLSAARTNDPNSHSCQFFIMHGANPGLDGQYSAFGETVFGLDVVDKIARTPGRPLSANGDVKPTEPQIIERAVVVMAKD